MISKSSRPKIFICIPTYNEAANIIPLLKSISAVKNNISNYSIHPVVIDDNSPDNTAEIVKIYMDNHPQDNVSILFNNKKEGLKNAYIRGFKYTIEHNAYATQMMDGDLSHDPKYLIDFIAQLPDYDFIIGSRYSKNGGTGNWNLIRRILSKSGNLYSRIILGSNIHDLTGGFNLIKNTVFQQVNIEKIRSNGYSFQIELKILAQNSGAKMIEIPIVFNERIKGKSKLGYDSIFEAILTPWKIRFSNKYSKTYS